MASAEHDPLEITHLVLVRHGQTAWNQDLRIQGHVDIGLTDLGQWQAQRVGQALAGEHFDAIFSSDLSRALDTALAIAGSSGRAVEQDVALRERGFGQFEGLTHGDIDREWPHLAQRWRERDPDFAPPGGGESLTVFHDRCTRCVAQLLRRHPGQRVAIVAHGGVLDSLYRMATHQSLDAPRTWALGNATINRLLWHGGGFSLVGWNDDRHLHPATT